MRDWSNQTDMAAAEWIVTMREGMRLEQQYPNDVMRVNYEELCRCPRVQLNSVASFLEFEPGDGPFLQYADQTLKPIPAKKPFLLNPLIETPFLQTMSQLDYGV